MLSNVDKLQTRNLIDIESFKYHALFDLDTFPWNALDQLDTFFRQFPFESNGNIFIGKNCKIDLGAKIEGPCVIGEGTEVRFGAYIRPGTLIGDGCVIGHASEISRSILLNGVNLPHFNYVGDSILGSNVNMGAGSLCSNVRLDKKEIVIKFDGESLKTGRKKLGAIIGENSSIGSNAVLNPGTIIFPEGRVLPASCVGGIIS